MTAFLDWLSKTPFSLFFGEAAWAIPTVQALHIMAIAAVLFSGLWIDMRVLGFVGRDQSFAAVSRRFTPWIGWGVVVLALTGLLLMVAEPTRALLNPYFQVKMAALAVVACLTWAMATGASKHQALWSAPETRPVAKLVAVVSLLLWALIVVAGRWIAYGP